MNAKQCCLEAADSDDDGIVTVLIYRGGYQRLWAGNEFAMGEWWCLIST
jgi:hypothetical protein